MVNESLDFSGRGRKLTQKKVKSMVEGSLDFSGVGRKVGSGKPKTQTVESSLDFVAQGRARAQIQTPSAPSGLDFVSLGRRQTQGIADMVEKSTGIPMVESITTTRTGKGKKRKVVSVKKFAKPQAKTGIKGKQAAGSIDLKSIVSGIRKFNEKGVGLGKKIGKREKKEPTRTEKALDQVLEKAIPIPKKQIEEIENLSLTPDQLTQRRLRVLIDEEKAKKRTLFSRLRGR